MTIFSEVKKVIGTPHFVGAYLETSLSFSLSMRTIDVEGLNSLRPRGLLSGGHREIFILECERRWNTLMLVEGDNKSW